MFAFAFAFESMFHIGWWICSLSLRICSFLQCICNAFLFSLMYEHKKTFPSCHIVPNSQVNGRTAVKTAYPPQKSGISAVKNCGKTQTSSLTMTLKHNHNSNPNIELKACTLNSGTWWGRWLAASDFALYTGKVNHTRVWISGNIYHVCLRPSMNKAEPTLALKPIGDLNRSP